jgi:5-formyltetrahydrofolate cyclo-ligase
VNHPPASATKADWREWARKVRSRVDWGAVSVGVVDSLECSEALAEGATVLTFLPMVNEVDLSALRVRRTDITWVVTRTPKRGALTVHPISSVLETHRYGFLQPVEESPPVDPEVIDVALVPGLVFDSGSRRLGHGGGYYDRLIPTLNAEARTIGVAADAIVVNCALPTDVHDVGVDAIVTETGIR